MVLLLLLLFIPCLFVWAKAVYELAKSAQISGLKVLLGILLALFAIIWPLVMWKVSGSIYVFGPPAIYMLFSVILPYYLGEMLLSGNEKKAFTFNLTLAHSLFLAVSIVFLFLCAYYFLAPDGISVAALLGFTPYH